MNRRELVQLVVVERWRGALALVLWIVGSLLPVVIGLVTRNMFDAVTSKSFEHAWWLLLVVLGVESLSLLTMRSWFVAHIAFEHRVIALVRLRTFDAMVSTARLPLSMSSGEVVGRIRNDADEATGLVNESYRLIGEILFAGVAIAIMVAIDVRITVLAILPLFGVIILVHLMSSRLRHYRTVARMAEGTLVGYLGDVLSGVATIRLAGAEANVQRHFRHLGNQRRVTATRDVLLQELVGSFNWNVANLARALVLVLGVRSLATGDFTVGDFFLFGLYLEWILEVPRRVGRVIASERISRVSAQRLTALAGGSPIPGPLCHSGGTAPEPEVSGIPDHGVTQNVVLDVRGLSAIHGSGPDGPSIHDISLRVHRGECVVITGRVGAGKSTLLRAILDLMPRTSGMVIWGADDTPQLSDESGSTHPDVAYVPQGCHLFSESLRDNVLLGLPDDDAALADAIQRAALAPDVEQMPNRMDTAIGPRGRRLSGGQIQRTGVARALIRYPSIVLLDDVTSSLDQATARQLWTGIRNNDRMGILAVSHQREALMAADQILLMEHGRLTARGTLAQLLAGSVEMQQLWGAANE